MTRSTDDLIKALEAKVPGFSYTVFSHRPGMPVLVQWNHTSPALQKREAFFVRTAAASSLRKAFEDILARYETFEREDAAALKKKQDEDRRKKRAQADAEAEFMSRPVARSAVPAPVDDEEEEAAEETPAAPASILRRSSVLPE